MEAKIGAFGEAAGGDVQAVLRAAAEVLECLRIDLEPRFYERLQDRATSFLSNELNDAFLHLIQREDGPSQAELFDQCDTVPLVIPRMYLKTVAASFYLLQLHNAREKLFANPNYAKKLERQGLPASLGKLRGARRRVLEELHEGATGIQSADKHIFFREFLFEEMKPYLDLQRPVAEGEEEEEPEEEGPAGTKDYEQCTRFMMNNYAEANRLWCRTAFEAARTKGEAARRDRKREYLCAIIKRGFLRCADYCMADEDRVPVLIDLIKHIKSCGDPMLASAILDQIVDKLSPEAVARNCDRILAPICAMPSGVKAFVSLAEKLLAAGLVSEKIYRRFCRHGMALARTLIDVQRNEGAEAVDRQAGSLAGQDGVASPWLSVMHQLLLLAARLWPKDLSKLYQALETIALVVYPDMEGCVQDVAKKLNPHAISFQEKEEDEKESAREEEEEEESEIVDEFAPVREQFSDFRAATLLPRDEQALVVVLAAPLQGLDPWLYCDYLVLAPVVVLREHMREEGVVVDDFHRRVCESLVDHPMLLGAEELAAQRAGLDEKLAPLTDFLLEACDDASFEVAQALNCCHCAHALRPGLERLLAEGKLREEARVDVFTALFFALVRDDWLEDAQACTALLDGLGSSAQVALRVECLRHACARGCDADGLYACVRALLDSFEMCRSGEAQYGVLVQMYAGLFNSRPAFGDETATVLKRFEAAAANLFARDFRAPALTQMARVYRLYEMEEAAALAEARAAECASRWPSEAATAAMALLRKE